jgi:hypothetical protein
MQGTGAVQAEDAADATAGDSTVGAAVEATADEVEQVVDRHPWITTVTRFGWGAKGIVYAVMGLLAVAIALSHAPEEDASPEGALSVVLERPFGRPLLGVVSIGLVLYALWRLLSVVLERGADLHAWLNRVGYAFSGTFYAVLAWSAIRSTLANDDPGRSTTVEQLSTELLGSGPGRLAVLVGAAIIVGVGLYFAKQAVTRDFRDELDLSGIGPLEARAVDLLGVIGHIGRSLVTILVGVFVGLACLRADPNEARGFDRSLRHVAGHPLGAALVLTAAVGLVLYGAFCLVSLRHRDLVENSGGGR